MKAKIRVCNPDTVEVMLEVSLPLGEWKRLREQLSAEYPAWRMGEIIGEMVRKLEAQIKEETK